MRTDSRLETRRTPTQARSRARVEAILEAAAELLATRGVDRLSMTDIAEASGMSKAALYRYFATKTAVVRVLADQMLDEDRAWLDRVLDPDSSDRRASTLAALGDFGRRLLADPYRVQLRAAVHADVELTSHGHRQMVTAAEAVTAYLSDGSDPAEQPGRALRVLLVLDLLDAVVDLASRVDPEDRERVLDIYLEMAETQL